MPLELRPLNQIIKRLAFTALVIVVGLVSFNIGTVIGAVKQEHVDQAEFSAWRNANACIALPDFSNKGVAKKSKVRQ